MIVDCVVVYGLFVVCRFGVCLFVLGFVYYFVVVCLVVDRLLFVFVLVVVCLMLVVW